LAVKKVKSENLLNKKSTKKKKITITTTIKLNNTTVKRKSKPKNVSPLIENGKSYCPICKKQECTMLDYGFRDEDEHWFKWLCKPCNVTFEVKKFINDNSEFIIRE